jgi:hypothetical protein
MRKSLVAFSVFCFAFSLPTVTFARDLVQESSGSSGAQGIRQEIKDKRQEIRQDFQEKKDDLKEKEASRMAELKAKRVEMLKKRFTFLSRNINAYLERLDKISGKISARILKLQAMGVDTSKAQAKLDESKALRDIAKTAVNKAIIDAQSVAGATDIKAATEKAMVSIRDAKTAIFNYHKKLVEATRELKAARELREGTGSAEKD